MAVKKEIELLLRLLDATKDIAAVLEIHLQSSGNYLLQRKIAGVKRRLPNITSQIKSLTRLRDISVISLDDFIEKEPEEGNKT